MNRQDTITLWRECQKRKKESLDERMPELEAQREASKVWNNWARKQIQDREELLRLGRWRGMPTNAKSRPNDLTPETNAWLKQAKADFPGVFSRRAKQDRMRQVAANKPDGPNALTDEVSSE